MQLKFSQSTHNQNVLTPTLITNWSVSRPSVSDYAPADKLLSFKPTGNLIDEFDIYVRDSSVHDH